MCAALPLLAHARRQSDEGASAVGGQVPVTVMVSHQTGHYVGPTGNFVQGFPIGGTRKFWSLRKDGAGTSKQRQPRFGGARAANDGGSMYAVFAEVNADASLNDQARQILEGTAVPMARDAGALAGYWLSAQGGRGVSVTVFDSEEAAKRVADQLKVGEAPPAAPPGVTFRTVEVREVLASL
jgi:hypothetical protein